MARQMMALCDNNIHYGTRLVDYLEEQKNFPYGVMHFSDVEQLRSYEEKLKSYEDTEQMDYLILGEDLYPYLKDDTNVKKIFLLTKDQETLQSHTESGKDLKALQSNTENRKDPEVCGKRKDTKVVRIYRYQPAGNIMRKIMGNLMEEEETGIVGIGKSTCKISGSGMKIIGVYTPVGRCMQTSFSLLLGQILTRQKRTLYLNMEGFSGFRMLLGRELKPDITDFMYYAQRDGAHFMNRLEHMIDTIGGLEYIPPATTYMDLSSITKEQWLRLFRELEADGRFGYLVLDLTEHVQGLFQILKQCDLIYTIESDDNVGNAKIQEYEELLGMMECEDVLRKTRKKHLPKIHRTNVELEQLVYSDLADYVRQLVKEDFAF